MNKAVLDKYNIDYKKGVARCMDDEELYERILSMFLDDSSFERSELAYKARDNDALFKCVHELKGTSGNAALTGLFGAACAIVDYLRAGKRDDAEIDALFAALKSEYLSVIEGVSLALSE